jgi:UDP-glucose 4-epimerase
VVVFDNLVNGHKDAVTCRLVIGDLLDSKLLQSAFQGEYFDAVIHFAAYAQTPESMKEPYKYFHNNIDGGLNLLEFMQQKNIKTIIFSSSCAIFGTPKRLPISEDDDKFPDSVYGESKLMFEKILSWYDRIYGIKYINLRYFNACGAALDASLGERHTPETHIIPLAIKTALAKDEGFNLYGQDYNTKDGTCVRDYIHVVDLAKAHILALKKLDQERVSNSYNLGTGKGYSNKEIIDAVKRISGVDFPVVIRERRAGDPPALYANNEKVTRELGFSTAYSDLDTIVKTAWEWHKKQIA